MSSDSHRAVASSALNLMIQDIMRVQEIKDHSCTSELEIIDRKIRDINTALTVIDNFAKGQIAMQHRRRNQFTSTILRLPEELISEIFVHLLQSVPLFYLYEWYPTLARLRQVCTQFKKISDGTPRLWARIGGMNDKRRDLDRAAMLLQKSKGALLDINIHFGRAADSKDPMSLLNLLLEHTHRWNTFRFYSRNLDPVSNHAFQASLASFASLCAPRLRQFSIEGSIDHLLSEARVNLLGGVAQSLKHLDIRPMFISWDSPLLASLTFLRIRTWDGVRSPTSEQYLRVLSSCPRLKELHLIGRDEHFRDDEEGAEFHSPITLSELATLSLEYLHPTTIKSILSSTKAEPRDLTIIFSGDLVDQWQEVMAATLLDPICSHLLTRFTSSPHTVELVDDEGSDYPLHAITITGEGAPRYFNCGFVGSSLTIAVYRALFQPEARATLKKCVLEVGPGQFNEQFGYRELLEDMVGLRELQVLGSSIGLEDILTPLSEQIPSSSSRAMWLCPQLHRLKLAFISFDIADLWKLIDARYGGDDPPTPSVQLVVEENTYHGDLNEVPIGTAVKISDLLGSKNFLWDGWTLKRKLEWE